MVSKDDRKNNSISILCIYQLSGMAKRIDITLWTMLERFLFTCCHASKNTLVHCTHLFIFLMHSKFWRRIVYAYFPWNNLSWVNKTEFLLLKYLQYQSNRCIWSKYITWLWYSPILKLIIQWQHSSKILFKMKEYRIAVLLQKKGHVC